MKIKIISDAACNLYIDQDKIASIPANELTIIPIEKGEYIFRYECFFSPSLTIEKDLLVEYDKVERISFLDMVKNNRLLYESLELVPYCDSYHRWGFVIKGTELIVIPCEYDEVGSFSKLSSSRKASSLSIVKHNGKYGVIDLWGEILVPVDYKTISKEWHYLCAFTFKGERHIISDEGHIFIRDNVNHPYLEFNANNYGLALDDLFVIGGVAYYPDGERIKELDIVHNAVNISRTLSQYNYYCPFYQIMTLAGEGIARVDRANKEVQWVSPSSLKCISAFIQDEEYTIRDDIIHPYSGTVFNNDIDKKEWSYLCYPTLGVLVQQVSVEIAEEYKEYPSAKDILPPFCSGLLSYEPRTHYFNVIVFNFNGAVVFAKDNVNLDCFCNNTSRYVSDNGKSGVISVVQFGVVSEELDNK